MAKNLKELIATRSAESQKRIIAMADVMLLELRMHELRKELKISQVDLAKKMGISQPSVVAVEQRGNEIQLATMKKYVEAMGGKLRIDVELPTGKHIGFNI